MSNYVALALDDGDPDGVYTRILARLQALLTGWQPVDGQPEVALAQAVSGELGDIRTLITNVGSAIFANWGRTLLQLVQLQAVPARLSVQFTFVVDSINDRIVPAGTAVGWPGATTDNPADMSFALSADLPVPAGTVSLTATLTAETAGAAANAVPAGPMVPLSNISWIASATAMAQASGGVDAETDDAYVDRLSLTGLTLSPTPILPADFAALATEVPGVARALAVDNWNPNTGETDVAKCVAVVPLDDNGYPVMPVIALEVLAQLQAMREANFAVFIGAPTYTTATIACTVSASGSSAATIAAVTAAVQAYCSPPTWTGGALRIFDLARVIGNAAGVDYATAITINGAATDLTLAGEAPLIAGFVANTALWATPSSITVTLL